MVAEAGKVRSTRGGENTLKVVSSMAQGVAAAEAEREGKEAVALRAQSQKKQRMGLLVIVVKVSNIADHAINMTLKKLDT